MVAATRKDSPSLPVLFIAAQLVDWLFFLFVLLDIEAMRVTPGISVMVALDLHHMPYTHSLVGSVAWAMLFAAIVYSFGRNRAAAIIAALVVLSHWFLDLLVHIPDLTIAGSEPKLGFGLWNHPAIEMPLELALTFGALWLYARHAKPKSLPLFVLIALLIVLQSIHWFGPVDPEVTLATILLPLFAFGLVTLVGYWVHRSARQ